MQPDGIGKWEGNEQKRAGADACGRKGFDEGTAREEKNSVAGEERAEIRRACDTYSAWSSEIGVATSVAKGLSTRHCKKIKTSAQKVVQRR
jgi:hypothetical protein